MTILSFPPPDDKPKKADKAGLGALSQSAKAKLEMNKMKAMSSAGGGGGASSFKFSVLAKIVRFMKNRHMDVSSTRHLCYTNSPMQLITLSRAWTTP